jgi:hypothetical protein
MRPGTLNRLPVQLREWAHHSAAAIEVMQKDENPDVDRLSYLRGTLAACNAAIAFIGDEPVPEPLPPAPRPWADGIEQYQVESR